MKLITFFFVIFYANFAFSIEPVVLVHGGAGTIAASRHSAFFKGTILAARNGYNALKNNGTVLDAVEAAIRSMEIDLIFNAGFGSVLTREGEVEMDACIMDGKSMDVGAVTGVQDIFHPVTLARRVMDKTNYNFLAPKGAMKLAKSEGFEFLPPGTLATPNAKASLDRWLRSQNLTYLHELGGDTVGAVAIDEFGNIAAATSTGGITGKLSGRIGDAPIVGAGTYADNLLGGISATGTGEVIMKAVLVFDILKRVEYLGEDINTASQTACDRMLQRFGGSGGVIALDKNGSVGIGFSTSNMAWAYQKGQKVTYGVSKGDNFEIDVE